MPLKNTKFRIFVDGSYDSEYKIGILYLKKNVNIKSLRVLKQRLNKIKKVKGIINWQVT